MHHYVYLIENVVNGKIYVGKHSTQDLDDGYMGSGKLLNDAIKKYGIENFRKRVLQTFDTEEDALAYERELVTEEFVRRDDTYNLNVGGRGSFWAANQDTPECKATKQRAARIGNHNRWTGLDNEKYRVRFSEKLSQQNRERHARGEQYVPDWTGKRHTDESKRKIGEANSLHQAGTKNSQFNTVWIFNPEQRQCRKIKCSELDRWLAEGWHKGRKMKFE